MRGGIDVVGCVTGTHVIADIQISVPHMVAVHIPADLVLRSKDLHRSLQQGRVMKLRGGSAIMPDRMRTSDVAKRQSDQARIAHLEAENKKLRRELQESQSREAGLHQVMASLGSQLTGIRGALGRLESQGGVATTVQYVQTPSGAAGFAVGPTEAVGGEAPTFMPEQITPDNVEASIQVRTEETKPSTLSGARSKLREMRKKNGDD